MSYRIEYSQAAIRDLDRVWNEVYEASKEADIATRYVDGLMDCVAEKRAFPKSGAPLYYENGFTGYYYVVFKAYMAFYRIVEERILVDRVVFGRSDYMQIFFQDRL